MMERNVRHSFGQTCPLNIHPLLPRFIHRPIELAIYCSSLFFNFLSLLKIPLKKKQFVKQNKTKKLNVDSLFSLHSTLFVILIIYVLSLSSYKIAHKKSYYFNFILKKMTNDVLFLQPFGLIPCEINENYFYEEQEQP